MANMKKFSDMKDIGHLCAHYERIETAEISRKRKKCRKEKNKSENT